jgi:diacylglycerol kinase (ATP)
MMGRSGSLAGAGRGTPRAILLLNSSARLAHDAPTDAMLRAFRSAGWDAELWAGDSPAWTAAAARRAVAQRPSAVFCAGGDGTLAAALPGVLGTSVPLGVVPLGTGNVWARELGLPLGVAAAIAVQLAHPPQLVDVGCANGRPFLSIASTGFDARIVQQVAATHNALGQLAYPLVGLGLAGTLHGVPSRVWINAEPPRAVRLLAGIVMNGHLYGGVLPLVPDSHLDDGLLEFVLLAGRGPFEVIGQLASLVSGRQRPDPEMVVRHVERIRIEPHGEPLPVQADGDVWGTTPLEVKVVPRGLLALTGRDRAPYVQPVTACSQSRAENPCAAGWPRHPRHQAGADRR